MDNHQEALLTTSGIRLDLQALAVEVRQDEGGRFEVF